MRIKYADGRVVENVDDVDSGLEILSGEYPDHTSTDDGERVLVWASEQDADGDDGGNAVAEIA